MKNHGFTLIEVMVVIAILSILAGMMIPFVYRLWESNDIETTREKMMELKRAMVGDPRLIQNGIRTHYGYVGDCGQLPSDIKYLIVKDLNCPDWNGPYLPPGFDPDKFDEDSWGKKFTYLPVGVSAELKSSGPDQQPGTKDDIQLQIYENETFPAKRITGNINLSLYNSRSDPVIPSYYAKATELLYNQGTNCYPLNIGQINPGETKKVMQTFIISLSIPYSIGNKVVNVQAGVYSDSTCNNNIISAQTSEMISIMSDTIFINIPVSYTIQ